VRPIGGVPYAFDIAADMRGNIWVSDSKDPVISRISAGTGDFPAAAAAPETIRVRPRAGRLAVDGGYLWVTNAVAASGTNASRDQILGAGTVSRIDLRSHRVVSTIPTAQLPLVIASGYGSIWVGNSDANFERSSVSVSGTGSSGAERALRHRSGRGKCLDPEVRRDARQDRSTVASARRAKIGRPRHRGALAGRGRRLRLGHEQS